MSDKEEVKRKLQAALTSLAMELEIKDGLRFNVRKGTDEIVNLLICASKSKDEAVKQQLTMVEQLLSSNQKSLLYKKGVHHFGDIPSEDDDFLDELASADEQPEEHKGKKKVVYRGQVKWV